MKLSRLRLLAKQDRVLVEVEPDVAASDGGTLVIPDAYRRFSRVGRVLGVGLGRYTRKGAWVPTTVRVGQRVLLPYAGDDTHAFDVGAVEHRLIHESELLGVID